MVQRPASKYTSTKTGQNSTPPERHVVLVTPEIHWNTGNIGRTCLAANACLHLIKPLGFSLESKEVKRAGLDYWEHVKLTVWESFAALAEKMTPDDTEVAVFTKTGSRIFWAMPRPPRLFLIFGAETRGLPGDILRRYPASTYHIPITDRTRSLNLSTAAGIALYESLRGTPDFHAWGSLQTHPKT
jgi:tRNA (cytidine/uridine-2'-O-)-methyltransferase